MSRKEDLRVKDVPDIVLDPSSKKRYARGRFLGKVYLNRAFVGNKLTSNL